MSKRLVRFALTAAIAVLATGAAAHASAPTAPESAASLASTYAAPWPSLQRADGSFKEYLPIRAGSDGYGPAMTGYAMLLTGLRTGNDAMVGSGLRGIGYAAAHKSGDRRSIFEHLALAAAYNTARAKLGDDPRFKAVAPRLQRTLRSVRFRIIGGGYGYFNFYLVEAVATLELLDTGLRSHTPGTVLADRRAARATVLRLINRKIPAIGRKQVRGRGDKRMTLVSDPPWNPAAYQSFSLALLSRAIDLLGPRAGRAVRSTLVDVARASAAMIAPDGDVSYYGRSQEQSWTLAMTAYGMVFADHLSNGSLDQPARTTARLALDRLAALHTGGAHALFLTPALGIEPMAGRRGLDVYVSGLAYSGLTIVGLEWLADQPPPPGGDQADNRPPGVTMIGRGAAQTMIVRGEKLWFVVRPTPAPVALGKVVHSRDLRYDAGLVIAKHTNPAEGWHDVVPPKPRTARFDSVGPLIRRGGTIWRPVGQRIQADGAGAATMNAQLRSAAGKVRHRTKISVGPAACGMRISFTAPAREPTEYSVFFRHNAAAGTDPNLYSDDYMDAFLSEHPARFRTGGVYASGTTPRLVRARFSFRPGAERTISITLCDHS